MTDDRQKFIDLLAQLALLIGRVSPANAVGYDAALLRRAQAAHVELLCVLSDMLDRKEQ